MKNNRIALFALSAVGLFGLVACGGFSSSTSFNPSNISNTWGESFETHVLADFEDNQLPSGFEKSDGWSNEGVFENTYWNQDNVSYSDGKMELSLTDNPNPDDSGKYKYLSGEQRTTTHFGYGNYSVKMKPMKAVGTCSAFFGYTGEAFDGNDDGEPDQWEEIDIEFLGKYHDRVQFNYYSIEGGNGVGHEYWYDLGFDATEEYHEYGFRWEEDRIVWFVDGEAVYEATKDIPSTPLRIFTNAWAGNEQAAGWMDTFQGVDENTCTAYYEEIGWADLDGNAYEPPAEEVPPVEDIEITYEDVETSFIASNEAYTVTTADGATNVTYDNVVGNSYINVYTDLPEKAKDMNVVNLKLTNNGDKTANARVNVVDKNIIPNNTTIKTAAVNTSATQDGEEVRTDLEWGGSFFTIEPNTTIDCVIFYKSTEDMVANRLEVMLDSFDGTTTVSAGDVTISDVKLGVTEGTESSDDLTFEAVDLTWAANADNTYTVTKEESGATSVTYTNAVGNSYHNITTALPADTADKGAFKMKLTNNGDKLVNARVDLLDTSIAVDGTTVKTAAVNTSATQDGEAVRTDLEWGGSFFTIEPKATIEAIIMYDGNAQSINLMLDSFDGTTTVSAGDVTISDFAFAAIEEGETPAEPTLGTAAPFDFSIDGGNTEIYNVSKDAETGASTITYESTGSYTNISGAIGSVATAAHGQISFKVNNTGTENVAIRVDIYHYNAWGTSLVSAATLDGNTVVVGGDKTATLDVAPGEHVVTVDHTGAVTNLCFYIDSMEGTSKAGSFVISDFTYASYNI